MKQNGGLANLPEAAGARKPRASRLYHGWLVAGAAFLSSALVIGTAQYAFGAFVQPLEQDLGWTRTQINASLSFFAIANVIGPLAGRLMDRHGVRPVMVASLALITLSYLPRPFMTQLWHWYLLSALTFVGLPGAIGLPTGKLIGLWFQKKRGRMMGLTAMGNNFGGLTIAPLAGFMVATAGWQWTYVAFAAMGAVVTAYVFLVVRDKPEEIRKAATRAGRLEEATSESAPHHARVGYRLGGLTVQQALKTRTFYAIALGLAAAMFTYSTALTQIVPHLENEGLSLGQASFILSITALFGMVGKLVFAYLTELTPVRYVVILSLVVQALSLVVLIAAPTSPMIWIFVVVFGVSFGGLGTLPDLLIQESFGVRYFGSIAGLVSLTGVVSFLSGPLMAGAIFDATGSYRQTYMVVAGLFLLGALVLTQARPPNEASQGEQRSTPSSERT